MRIVHVASEVAPWSQTGGLADVVGALPAALRELGVGEVHVLSPLYRVARAKLAMQRVTLTLARDVALDIAGHRLAAQLLRCEVAGVTYWWLACEPLYDRIGIYGDTAHDAYADNWVRYAALAHAALALPELIGSVDILHGHDWQAALAIALARLTARQRIARGILTVHNLAFRGLITHAQYEALGLPPELYTMRGFEFWGQASLLKGGLALADVVSTVSPSYAEEIMTPQFGEGLDGFLRFDAPRMVGIVNGIDTEEYDPARGEFTAASYSSASLEGKRQCKAALAAQFPVAVAPTDFVLGIVARMTTQKGFDLVAELAPQLAGLGARLVVLGAGEPELQARFTYLQQVFSHHVAVTVGFSPPAARAIYAGADAFLMPSRFEPCGLGQLYAMRYGTLPIVAPVGGLRDTVRPDIGFVMEAVTATALRKSVAAAAAEFRDNAAWRARQTRAMQQDLSWRKPAAEYWGLYRSLA